jgi:hypothetical protein
MSLPVEQARALAVARNFISRICSRQIKRIPTAVRQEARGVLKHMPMSWDLPRIVEDGLAMDVMQEAEAHYRKLFWEECNNVKVEDA